MGEAGLKEAVYGPLLDSLAAGPKTTLQLTEEAGNNAQLPHILEALLLLCVQGHVAPALGETGDKAREQSTRRFNEALMRRSIYSDDLEALASPITGGGVPLGRIEQLCLLEWRRDKNADIAKFVWSCLATQGRSIIKDGQALEGGEANLEELNEASRKSGFPCPRRSASLRAHPGGRQYRPRDGGGWGRPHHR